MNGIKERTYKKPEKRLKDKKLKCKCDAEQISPPPAISPWSATLPEVNYFLPREDWKLSWSGQQSYNTIHWQTQSQSG